MINDRKRNSIFNNFYIMTNSGMKKTLVATNAIANAGFAWSSKHWESLHTFVLADSWATI
jgi:hypothetical protein